MAAAVLEVLAGVRSVADAASALGLSSPRYYVLEGRALEGLVQGCEPREKGPRPSAEREAAKLRREVSRLERELGRQQALARAASRAAGLAASKPPPPPKGHGKRRRKKPVVRALRAARRLQSTPTPEGDGGTDAGRGAGASMPAVSS